MKICGGDPRAAMKAIREMRARSQSWQRAGRNGIHENRPYVCEHALLGISSEATHLLRVRHWPSPSQSAPCRKAPRMTMPPVSSCDSTLPSMSHDKAI